MTPVVFLGYVVANEDELLSRSLAVMQSYDWVSKIFVLESNVNKAMTTDDGRTFRWGLNFGQGFEQQPEAGGFHEIDARNHLLFKMHEFVTAENTWFLLCDADEFFLPDMIHTITAAQSAGKQAVNVECWHMINRTDYIYYRNRCWRSGGYMLHEGHLRAIKANRRFRYAANPNINRVRLFPNRTMHCHLGGVRDSVIHVETAMRHIHVKDITEKRQRISEPHEIKTVQNLPWPQAYLDLLP